MTRSILNRPALLLSACTLLLAGAIASAHHSFAVFDLKKRVELQGTVREFQWTNPHIWIYVDVKGPDGALTRWEIEGGSPRALGRAGWTRDTLTPGDAVTLGIHPMRSGAQRGALVYAVLADGSKLVDPDRQ